MNIARIINPVFRRNKVVSTVIYNGFKTCGRINHYITKSNEESNLKMRSVSTYEVKSVHNDGFIKRITKKIPFLNFDKIRATASAYILYENIADQINYIVLFEELKLRDSFYSWFVVTELYVWMLSVRAMAEGEDGRHMRNGLVEALWLDVAQRVKKLGVSTSFVKQQVFELSEQLQAALLAYDEGIQSSDTVLASALWRRLYQGEYVDPEVLLKLVKHIRKQVLLLDNMSKQQIFSEKSVRWEPLNT